ncbi:hypothetical protein SAI_0342, partial [Streptococcus agalactiae H36B]
MNWDLSSIAPSPVATVNEFFVLA